MDETTSAPPVPMRVSGAPPWFPSLAEVMEPAPDLLDDLASGFAPHAVGMDPDAFWTAFHCYITEQLMNEVFGGDVDEAWLRRAIWVSYGTGIWCTRSWRVSWMQLDPSMAVPTTAEGVAPLVHDLATTLAALNAGGTTALDRLAELLRLPAFHGALLGTAYNTGYLVVIGERPPIGNRPPHVELPDGYIRASGGQLLDLAYTPTAPTWLADTVTRYERLVTDGDGRLARVIDGAGGPDHLAELWRTGFEQGVTAWGNSLTGATQSFYDPFFRWSVVYNFGIDAISRAAIVAVATGDESLSAKALAGNLIYNASWSAFPFGVLDDTIDLPTVAPA